MEEAYIFANNNHYDYFTTVMSISNRKNADYINEIGENLQNIYIHNNLGDIDLIAYLIYRFILFHYLF